MSAGQYVVVPAEEPRPNQVLGRVSLFNEDGTPWEPGSGAPAAVAWGDVTGKPSTFPPATHEHTIADVTGLADALDALETSIAALDGRVTTLETAE